MGDHVTIPRTGYFGCDQDDARMVTWFTKAKASDYSSLTKVLAADGIIHPIRLELVCSTGLRSTELACTDRQWYYHHTIWYGVSL
ncbi:hypothetical protein DPMN_175998 [Dreissena polymorpha]|uniref:Uncharacterized protein n=1 Tax=Dreissena polymorpha TaxID=45954 RepID=A0A9D4E7I6_DREPO|nr:hypothetical protein DPMN_175998 [Dreissena polymorpha]